MSLATRCSACGTVFRVVQDQLKISEGWVRCGRCNEVFNALESLFDLDAAAVEANVATPEAVSAGAEHTDWPAPSQAADPPSVSAQVLPPPTAFTSPLNTAEGLHAHGYDAGQDHASAPLAAATGLEDHSNPAAPDEPAGQASPPLPDLRADPPPLPAFVQQANRAARWRRPGVRRALGLGSAVLALLLLLQMGAHFRDLIAARWAPAKPVLSMACRLLGCQVQSLRRLDQLSVDSSGLTRIEGSPLYRLSVVLRNRADIDLMMPAIDLSLTDAQGQVIARRVLSVSEIGSAATALAAGKELPLQAMLSTGSRRIAGYTIEVFYP